MHNKIGGNGFLGGEGGRLGVGGCSCSPPHLVLPFWLLSTLIVFLCIHFSRVALYQHWSSCLVSHFWSSCLISTLVILLGISFGCLAWYQVWSSFIVSIIGSLFAWYHFTNYLEMRYPKRRQGLLSKKWYYVNLFIMAGASSSPCHVMIVVTSVSGFLSHGCIQVRVKDLFNAVRHTGCLYYGCTHILGILYYGSTHILGVLCRLHYRRSIFCYPI